MLSIRSKYSQRNQLKIKFCDIKDIHAARLCGNVGVDFIGMHAIYQLKSKNIEIFKIITEELFTHYQNTRPTLVTKIMDIERLVSILKKIYFPVLQIYPIDEVRLNKLKHRLSNIETDINFESISYDESNIFQDVISDIKKVKEKVLQKLGKEIELIIALPTNDLHPKYILYIHNQIIDYIDYSLLDTSVRGGTGRLPCAQNTHLLLERMKSSKIFLAGGINSKNVLQVIERFPKNNIYGIDIQSGITIYDKNRNDPKDPRQIIDFISLVKKKESNIVRKEIVQHPKSRSRLISWAITDFQSKEIFELSCKIMSSLDIDIVHIDFSNGTIAPRFNRMPFNLLENLAFNIPCINYDIHLFIDDYIMQSSIINKCLSLNPVLKIVYLHLITASENDFTFLFNNLSYIHKNHPNINLGIAIQSTKFNRKDLFAFLHKTFLANNINYIHDISLITHSNRHKLEDVIEHDKEMLEVISIFRNNNSLNYSISIDRDINLNKAKMLTDSIKVNQIIIGKSINQKIIKSIQNGKPARKITRDNQTLISKFRDCL